MKRNFFHYFSDGLLETFLLSQVLGLIAALVLLIYGEMDSPDNVIPISFIFTNCFGLCIKALGAGAYSLFYRRETRNWFFHLLLWFPSIVLGSFIGSELAIGLNSWWFDFSVPNQFYEDHFVLLGANLLICASFSILAFVLVLIRKRLKRKTLENERILHLQTQTQLVALQSKINPHFLFNTLNTMLSLVHKAPDKVETMILNLSDIYRKILQYPEDQLIPFSEEVQLLNEYLEIEKIRMGERLSYSVDVDPTLVDCRIPPLLIEPVVENAIIHGISPKTEGGRVNVSVNKSENKMNIRVVDDGMGMKKAGHNWGFGLSSVKERLEILYNERAFFEIIELSGGGVEVRMEIPCED